LPVANDSQSHRSVNKPGTYPHYSATLSVIVCKINSLAIGQHYLPIEQRENTL
jgi:hypothetical protein